MTTIARAISTQKWCGISWSPARWNRILIKSEIWRFWKQSFTLVFNHFPYILIYRNFSVILSWSQIWGVNNTITASQTRTGCTCHIPSTFQNAIIWIINRGTSKIALGHYRYSCAPRGQRRRRRSRRSRWYGSYRLWTPNTLVRKARLSDYTWWPNHR